MANVCFSRICDYFCKLASLLLHEMNLPSCARFQRGLTEITTLCVGLLCLPHKQYCELIFHLNGVIAVFFAAFHGFYWSVNK